MVIIKVIIAGSRVLKLNKDEVQALVDQSDLKITEVVSGVAPGVDSAGLEWANSNKIPTTLFHAQWDNFDIPFVAKRKMKSGKEYNAAAGIYRNQQMAEYAEGLLLIWTGDKKESPGSFDMLLRARKQNLKIVEILYRGDSH